MIHVLIAWSKNSFCISKSYFRASQVITKTLFQFDSKGPNQGNKIFQDIDQDTQIEDAAKQQVKKMFDPQHGFKLPEGFQAIQRFQLALNKRKKYAMNPNAIMLSTAPKIMLSYLQTNKFQYTGGSSWLVYGTSGSSKSCSFFNFAKILNMKMAYLLKDKSPKDSLFRQNAKIFFLLTFQRRDLQFRRILYEIKVDFGQQEYEKVVKQYQQNLRLYQKDDIQTRIFIQQIFNLYRNKGLKVIVILDQFNSVYKAGKDKQIEKFDQVPFLRIIHQCSSKPTYLISSKNIEFLNRDLTKNMTKFDPIVEIFQTYQNLGKINVESYNVATLFKNCISFLAFEIQKYFPDPKFADQVIKKLNGNLPFQTHLNIASAVKAITLEKSKNSIDADQFAQLLLEHLQKDIQNMKNNISDNLKIVKLIAYLYSKLLDEEVTVEYSTSQNQKLLVRSGILYIPPKGQLKEKGLYDIVNINYFYEQKDRIYTKFKLKQVEQLYQFCKRNYAKQMDQFAQQIQIKDDLQGKEFQKQFKSMIIEEGINNKDTKQKLKFQITFHKLLTIQFSLQPRIKYFKMPNINSNIDLQGKKNNDTIIVTSSQQSFEMDLKHSYSWKEMIATFQRECNYLSANVNNLAYDFILSINQNGRLTIFFVDLTVSSDDSSNIKKKYAGIKQDLISNPNLYTLLQSINNSTNAEQIVVYFYVVSQKILYPQFKTFQWSELEEYKSTKKLEKINREYHFLKGSFGQEFRIFQGKKQFRLDSLKNYPTIDSQNAQKVNDAQKVNVAQKVNTTGKSKRKKKMK